MLIIPAKANPATQLPSVTVGRGGALEIEVVGAPDGLQELQLHVSDAESPHTYTAVPATSLPDNRWRVYASGLFFRTVGKSFYQLTGKDGRDNSVWLGKGRLVVVDSVLHADSDDVPIIPEDCFVRNPATGLWHKVTSALDEDGIPYMVVAKEGVEK